MKRPIFSIIFFALSLIMTENFLNADGTGAPCSDESTCNNIDASKHCQVGGHCLPYLNLGGVLFSLHYLGSDQVIVVSNEDQKNISDAQVQPLCGDGSAVASWGQLSFGFASKYTYNASSWTDAARSAFDAPRFSGQHIVCSYKPA